MPECAVPPCVVDGVLNVPGAAGADAALRGGAAGSHAEAVQAHEEAGESEEEGDAEGDAVNDVQGDAYDVALGQDVDGANMSAAQRTQRAAADVLHLARGTAAVTTFDARVYAYACPWLFVHLDGGPPKGVSVRAWVRHLVCRAFHAHGSDRQFMALACLLLRRHDMLLHAKLGAAISMRSSSALSDINNADVHELVRWLAGEQGAVLGARARAAYKAAAAVRSASTPQMREKRTQRDFQMALTTLLGPTCSVFATLNPADLYHVLLMHLAGTPLQFDDRGGVVNTPPFLERLRVVRGRGADVAHKHSGRSALACGAFRLAHAPAWPPAWPRRCLLCASGVAGRRRAATPWPPSSSTGAATTPTTRSSCITR